MRAVPLIPISIALLSATCHRGTTQEVKSFPLRDSLIHFKAQIDADNMDGLGFDDLLYCAFVQRTDTGLVTTLFDTPCTRGDLSPDPALLYGGSDSSIFLVYSEVDLDLARISSSPAWVQQMIGSFPTCADYYGTKQFTYHSTKKSFVWDGFIP